MSKQHTGDQQLNDKATRNQDKDTRSIQVCVFIAFALSLFIPMLASAADPVSGSRNSSSMKQAKTLIIIGASYANNWDIQTLGSFRIVNKGVGGEETHQMLSRFEREVIKEKPSAVLIWGFINDIFRSSRDAVGEKKQRAQANIEKMTRMANAAGIRTILATEVLVSVPDRLSDRLLGWYGAVRGKQSYQDYVNEHVRDVNIWIRGLGKSRNLTVLDFERVLAGESGGRQRKYATEDGSHLTPEAYSMLTTYATAEFSKSAR